MGENTLLALASTYLLSEEGKKLIDNELNSSTFKSQSQTRLQSIASLPNSEGISSRSDLSREERKQIRQEQRDISKTNRQEKKEQADQYTPELKQFNIKGRIYDKKANTPLEGVKIEVVIEEPIYIYRSNHQNTTLKRLGRTNKTEVRKIISNISIFNI